MDKLPLKLLLIEDSQTDAELAVRAIAREGFDVSWQRVDNEAGMISALHDRAPQVIISDFSMPGFDGMRALDIAHEKLPETPFIFLSGTIGEERAIDAIKRGATDYVLKDHPQRLGSAVRRALNDARERRTYEERIRYLANFDGVTGLPNRSLLNDRGEQAVARAMHTDRPFALIVVSLDRFARVIDSYGHALGDKLLHLVADRLDAVSREGDTVAHLGGGTFAVLTLDGGREAIVPFVRRIQNAIRGNWTLESHDLHCAVNIGISLFPDDTAEFETLLRNAESAMHRVEDHAGEGFEFYANSITQDVLARVSAARDLRRALDQGDLTMQYQPQVDLISGAAVGVEALMRWHTQDDVISAAHFIPVAEESDLIFELGKLSLTEACLQGAALQHGGTAPIRVAVNMSARQFHDSQFLATVRRALEISDLPVQLLEIELTESVLVQDQDAAIAILNELKALGVQIAVDDFGTGYSSLSYLSRLPIDRLKIDCSFIQRLNEHGRDATIVQAIISLAHSLGLAVVAEGVETQRQLAFLRHYACDEAQGFLLSRPVDAAKLHEVLSKPLLT